MYFLEFNTTQLYRNCLESQLLNESLIRAFTRHLWEKEPPKHFHGIYGRIGDVLCIYTTSIDCEYLTPLTGWYRLVDKSIARNDNSYYTYLTSVQIYKSTKKEAKVTVEYVENVEYEAKKAGNKISGETRLFATHKGFSISMPTIDRQKDEQIIKRMMASRNSGTLPYVMQIIRPKADTGYVKINNKKLNKELWTKFLTGNLNPVLNAIKDKS